MPLPFEVARFDALKQLAAERFGKVTPAEEEVLRLSASAEGRDAPESNDRPEVRAGFLRWLATDMEAAAQVDPLGLRVEGATITSVLNLDFCKVPFRLRFRRCTLQGEFSVRSAELPALYLLNCKAEHEIFADNLRSEGSVFLRGLEARGAVRFPGAKIGGGLDCSGATFTADGHSLIADGADVAGDVFLRKGFSCSGEIRLLGAQIGGDLDCTGAVLTTEGDAISADGVNISGNVFLRANFSCSGEIRFPRAQIGGDVDCSGAMLTAKGNALSAEEASISGSVILKGKFVSSGAISFLAARIGGNLESCGAALSAAGDTLGADRARVAGDVFLDSGFYSSGRVHFLGTRIGGDVVCLDAQIKVLACERSRLGGSLIWTAVRNPQDSYLDLSGTSINTLHDDAASWPAPGRLVVKGLEYEYLAGHEPSTDEHINRRRMASQCSPRAGERIRWLMLQADEDRLDPHAWIWLAKLFRERGQDGDARWVLLNYRLRQAIAGRWFLWPIRVPLALLSWEPLLVLLIFFAILIVGHQTYQKAWEQHQICPTTSDTFIQMPVRAPPAQAAAYAHAYPVFNPWIYTLENELPLVKFGMDEKWAPDPNLIARGNETSYWWLAGFRWFLIIAGWIQGIALTFGINRRFHD